MKGKLYGIGVGPGDPSLITLQAVRVLNSVDVIFTAASPRNDYSIALQIAMPHLPENIEIIRLDFPMTRDEEVLNKAWNVAAKKVMSTLQSGQCAAFITLGDPLIYSTFGYLFKTLQKLDATLPIDIIPGITSFQATAASTKTILCEGQETLYIIPGIKDDQSLQQNIDNADTIVILKAYKNFPTIMKILEDKGRKDTALLASHVGRSEEQVYKKICAAPKLPPYLSLVISRK